MNRNIIKFLLATFVCFVCITINAQAYLSNAKDILLKNILDLDPIEGVYDVEVKTYIYTSLWGALQPREQHNNWAIIRSDRCGGKQDSNFVAYDTNDGEPRAIILKLAQDNYYTMKWYDVNQNEHNGRFYLKNGVTFEINDESYMSETSAKFFRTFFKSFPTTDMYRSAINSEIKKNTVSSGTGFFITSDYIVTNNHVIQNAQNGNIKITGINNDFSKNYKVKVEVTDKQNDLAILKITDTSFMPSSKIPYTFKFSPANVGEDCFVLGYPLISSMGKDIKLTTGIISSKAGYEDNIAQYQISAPIQPGNSGGPLFDKNGCIIGVVQAKHTQAENAGYAIKSNYIKNLIDMLPIQVRFPQTNLLNGKSLPAQVELAQKFVCLIIVNGED